MSTASNIAKLAITAAIFSTPAHAATSARSVDGAFERAITNAERCQAGSQRNCKSMLPNLSKALGLAERYCAASNKPSSASRATEWEDNCDRYKAAADTVVREFKPILDELRNK